MDVAVIGPGRVGGALALGLRQAGHRVTSVAGAAATPGPSGRRFLDLVPEAAWLPVAQAPGDADLVLLTTPDDVVRAVVATVVTAEAVRPGQRWVHTAGGLGLAPLAPIAAAGGRTAACHPAMTFTDPHEGAARLPGASWAVTAADEDLDWARLLVLDLRGSPVALGDGDRVLYHAGLTIGSNGTTAVVSLARDLLRGAGIGDPGAFLAPLATASADGAAATGVAALTGPIRRGDVGTVTAHLRELRRSYPEALTTYAALGRLILAQAVRAGLDAAAAAQIAGVLDEAAG
jgi:predicted short-subunit dehydrogenase-like oxidoreductase (DUF2520 family)